MPVRLTRPYNGQNTNTLYVGSDEAILRAIGIADDYVELASNYVAPSIPSVAQSFRAFASSFSTASPAGSFITSFSNPFAGQGRGITTYTLTGTVPPQVALSATSRFLVIGSTPATAGSIYTVNVTAKSGDGLLTTQAFTFNFLAVAQSQLVGGSGGNPTPTPNPNPTPLTTYANNTLVYANNSDYSVYLIPIQQRITSLGYSTTNNFGTSPNTPTGDTIYGSLVKFQNTLDYIEASAAATQDNTLAGNNVLLSGLPAWASRFQSIETRLTTLGAL